MNDSKKPKLQENVKKGFIPVKSKYLDFTKKSSSQSDHSGPSRSVLKPVRQNAVPESHRKASHSSTIQAGGFQTTKDASALSVLKPQRTLKTSTPTKDNSSFAIDISVVPVGNEHGTQKTKEEDPVLLSEKTWDEYNLSLLLHAMQVHVDKQKAEFAKTADTQLTIFQKIVEDSACTLSNLQLKIDASTCLCDIQEGLDVAEEVIAETVADPIFSDAENFQDLARALEGTLEEIPCKNMRVPSSQEDLDDIENAAEKVSTKLSSVSLTYGDEIQMISKIKDEVSKIDSFHSTLTEANLSVKELMPMATTRVLDETAKSMMNSTVANMDIKF